MSILNDPKRCLDIVQSDDVEKRKLIYTLLPDMRMSFGKHKNKSFKNVWAVDPKWSKWACDNLASKSNVICLFKKYIEPFQKPVLPVYVKRVRPTESSIRDIMTRSKYMRYEDRKEVYCNQCESLVEVKETFSCDVCSVCSFPL